MDRESVSQRLVELCNQFQSEIIQIEDDFTQDDIEYLGEFLAGMGDDLPEDF